MKKFLFKKMGGYIISLEIMTTVLIWSLLSSFTVNVINIQKEHKMIYNSFISIAVQTCKWGGTNSNIFISNRGQNVNLAKMMEEQLESYTGKDITLTVTPEKVNSDTDKIYVKITWKDSGIFAFSEKEHEIKAEFNPLTYEGILV